MGVSLCRSPQHSYTFTFRALNMYIETALMMAILFPKKMQQNKEYDYKEAQLDATLQFT